MESRVASLSECHEITELLEWYTKQDVLFTNEGSEEFSASMTKKKLANIRAAFQLLFDNGFNYTYREVFSLELSHKIHAIICSGLVTGGGELWNRKRHGPQVSDGSRHEANLSETGVKLQLEELFSFCNDFIIRCSSESREPGMTWQKKIEAGAYFIQRYLAIHPYCDGNGRVSRLLTSLLLMRLGATAGPVCFNLRPENRRSYVDGLNAQGVTGPESEALRPLADFLQQAAEDTIRSTAVAAKA